MADMNKIGMAYLTSNDPAPSTSYDYEVNRRRGGDPLMQDISGVTPMRSDPGLGMAANGTNAAFMATIARMLMEAPGLVKATAAVPAVYAADYGMDAFRNYQQLQGTHPMQERQKVWEMLLEAAVRPTQSTPFRRGDSY